MRISDWSSDVCSSDLPESWQVRSEQVREHGLQPLLAATAERWFTPAFNATHPDVVRDILQRFRSEERRVGKECVSTCSSRWSPYHYNKKETLYYVST